jgi:mevalonate kinase
MASAVGIARAHGKVILLGEHAVVYGVPALAVGIDRGARASASSSASGVPTLSIDGRPALGSEMWQAWGALCSELQAPCSELGELSVAAELEVPPGAGLGSSAALGVAIARAALEALGRPASAETVLAAADAWERVFHGNPSGIDTTAAFHGGCFKFKRGLAPEFVELATPLRLAIVKAGPAASTKTMVESVARLRERRPQLVDKTLEGIHSLVQNAALCLSAGDRVGLGKLMDYNQMLLSGLFLSTPEIERACGIARERGAFGAKLTGAGGGGAVIALADDPETIVEAWKQAGLEAFVATCSGTADAERAPTSGAAESEPTP